MVHPGAGPWRWRLSTDSTRRPDSADLQHRIQGDPPMLRKFLLPAAVAASALLAGCATGYTYRSGSGDYYYGQPRVEYRDYGYYGYGYPYGYSGYYGYYGYGGRSEEHTSELQSRENLVCRLLLEKKKKKHYDI